MIYYCFLSLSEFYFKMVKDIKRCSLPRLQTEYLFFMSFYLMIEKLWAPQIVPELSYNSYFIPLLILVLRLIG